MKGEATATTKRLPERKKAKPSPGAGTKPRSQARRLKVQWTDAGPIPVPRPKALAALATLVLKQEGIKGDFNLVFCGDALVRKLNRQFRGLDKVTDVLSFHYGDIEAEDPDPDSPIGEIYVATAQAKKQAPRWENSFYEELRRLVVHGALHLAGHDHMKARERLTMRALEDHYLTKAK